MCPTNQPGFPAYTHAAGNVVDRTCVASFHDGSASSSTHSLNFSVEPRTCAQTCHGIGACDPSAPISTLRKSYWSTCLYGCGVHPFFHTCTLKAQLLP